MTQVESLTGVPVANQKLFARKGWKGVLSSTTKLKVKPGKTTLTLIGTTTDTITAITEASSQAGKKSEAGTKSEDVAMNTKIVRGTGQVVCWSNGPIDWSIDIGGYGVASQIHSYVFVPFQSEQIHHNPTNGDFIEKIPQLYPNGTPIIRRSQKYRTCTRVTSITTTDNSMTIDTDKGRFVFLDITNFIRRKNNDTEPTFHTSWSMMSKSKMTLWSQTERDSVFASIFASVASIFSTRAQRAEHNLQLRF